MLYETLSQPAIFLWMFLSGFGSGFFFDIKTILLTKIKKKKIFNEILSFFMIFFTFFAYYLTNLLTNYGQIRFWTVLVFVLSFALQRFLLTKFVAFYLTKCYNNLKVKFDAKQRKKTKNK